MWWKAIKHTLFTSSINVSNREQITLLSSLAATMLQLHFMSNVTSISSESATQAFRFILTAKRLATSKQPHLVSFPDHIHKRHVPSAPALTHQGSLGCQSTSITPKLFLILCPLRTLTGTIVAFSIISDTTFPWKI